MGSLDLFDTNDVVLGYAAARPPVHPPIIRLAAERVGLPVRVDVALDVGCGTGLSTRPLVPRSRRCVAIDPVPAMVARVADIAPGAVGAVGRAEALPVPDRSVDLLTAAGSLDFVDHLGASAVEISRVLAPAGVVLVYDFATGQRLRAGPEIGPWFDEVLEHWPRRSPPTEPVSTAALAVGDLVFEHHPFEVDVALSRRAYVDYLLTESFVTAAVGRGERRADIGRWLSSTVPWPSADHAAAVDVVFTGYFLVGRRRP